MQRDEQPGNAEIKASQARLERQRFAPRLKYHAAARISWRSSSPSRYVSDYAAVFHLGYIVRHRFLPLFPARLAVIPPSIILRRLLMVSPGALRLTGAYQAAHAAVRQAERRVRTAIVFGRQHANAMAGWSPSPVTREAGAARRGPASLLGLADEF